MNPSILVPVDFTDDSFNAYHHANHLAYRLGYELLLVHVLSGFINVEKFLGQRPGHSLEEILTNRLKSFSRWHPNEHSEHFFPVITTYKLLEGNILSEILHLAKDPGIALLVAGTSNSQQLRDRWLGSVALGLSEQAPCPVMLVPTEANFKSFDKIVVASDYHANDFFVLEQFMTFNKVFNADTHFVHVREGPDDTYSFHEGEIQEAMSVYGQPEYKVEMVTLKGSDVFEVIYDYAGAVMADLMVWVSEKRPLVRSLMHHSETRKAVRDCKIPTLIYHATVG